MRPVYRIESFIRVNGGMTHRIHGLSAPAPRLTPLGAALLALIVALPAGAILWFAALFWP